jgi:hypothetical protein
MSCNTSVRHNLPATETMKKYFGEIERMLYSAEIYCKGHGGSTCKGDIQDCPFRKYGCCDLVMLRAVVGDHHDPLR